MLLILVRKHDAIDAGVMARANRLLHIDGTNLDEVAIGTDALLLDVASLDD